jgi:hypothetical protein
MRLCSLAALMRLRSGQMLLGSKDISRLQKRLLFDVPRLPCRPIPSDSFHAEPLQTANFLGKNAGNWSKLRQ